MTHEVFIVNVVIYARYSSDRQTEQSIEGQLKECHAFAQRYEYTVVHEYIDRAISGTTDNRPQFLKMIEDSKSKHFQGIIVYQLDRFTRNRYDSAIYKRQLQKNGVRVLSARENISDDASGILLEALLEAQAEHYSVELSQKIKRGLDINAEKGYVVGGIPLGYYAVAVEGANKSNKKVYAVDEKTAPYVKRIFEMCADEGKTIKQICDHFNVMGVKTSKNSDFNKNSLRTLLRNKKYIGVNVYNGQEYPGTVPRIIDDDLFERVQQTVAKNKKGPARNKATGDNEYLLTFKLFCGHCRELMTGWSGTGKSGKLHPYYKCNSTRTKIKTCDKKNVRRDSIENTVIKLCREALTDDKIEEIATEVVAFNEAEQRNNEVLKELKKLVSDNKKQQDNLMGTLKLCEDDDTKRMILSEMSKMGKVAKELEYQLALEESRKITITRREIVFFLKDLQNGDVENIKYRKVLINVFVNKVYLYDDGRLTVFFNNGDTTTEVDTALIDKIEADVLDKSGTSGYFIGDSRPVHGTYPNPLYIYVTDKVFVIVQKL